MVPWVYQASAMRNVHPGRIVAVQVADGDDPLRLGSVSTALVRRGECRAEQDSGP
jgi:hypothetical protein